MNDFAIAISDQIPSDNKLRVGTVVSLNPFTVDVQGSEIPVSGCLGQYEPAVGDVVSILREDQTFLVMGEIVPAGSVHKLPEPIAIRYNATQVITATAWANHPVAVNTIQMTLPKAAIVQVQLNAWLTLSYDSTGGGTLRLGVRHNDQDPSNSFGGAWGNVLMVSTAGGAGGLSASSGQRGMSATEILPAGTHTFTVQAYKTGTHSTSANYWIMRITPLRWVK